MTEPLYSGTRPAWRNGSAYDALRRIDRAGLMWEWLRRDEDYIAWYARASAATRATEAPSRWGLHFRRRPASPGSSGQGDLERCLGSCDSDGGCRAGPWSGEDRIELGELAPWLTIVAGSAGSEHVLLSDGWHHVRLDVAEGQLKGRDAVWLQYRIDGLTTAGEQILPLRRFLALCRLRRFPSALFPRDPRIARGIDMLRVHDALDEEPASARSPQLCSESSGWPMNGEGPRIPCARGYAGWRVMRARWRGRIPVSAAACAIDAGCVRTGVAWPAPVGTKTASWYLVWASVDTSDVMVVSVISHITTDWCGIPLVSDWAMK
jgi:hypothetical protein